MKRICNFVLMSPLVLFVIAGPTYGESLQVTLSPEAAIELDARWRILGESLWRPSADVVDGLAPGVVKVELKELDGCNPKSKVNPIQISLGQTKHVTLEYEGERCGPLQMLK